MKIKSLLWSLLAVFALSAAGCSDDDEVVAPQPDPETPETEMTFTLKAENVTATSGEFTVTPSDVNKTFAADVLPAAMLDKAGADKVIEMTLQSVKPEDLMKGETKFSADKLDPETEYVLFAVGVENGKATTKLATKRFTTLKEEAQPEPEGQNNNGEVIDMTAEQFNQWIYDVKADADKTNFLSEIPAVIDFYGPGCGLYLEDIFAKLAKEFNGKINFFRFNFTKKEHKEVKEYMDVKVCPTLTFITKGKADKYLYEKQGSDNIQITEAEIRAMIEEQFGIKSEGEQPEATAPVVTLSGRYDEAADKCVFSARCTSGDAKEGFLMVYATDDFEVRFLAAGVASIEEYFAKMEQEFQVMSAKELKVFNSEAGVDAPMPYQGFGMTMVLAARNEAGQTVKRADVDKKNEEVDPQPQPGVNPGVEELAGETYGDAPKAHITVGLGTHEGTQKDNQFYFVIDCPSKDATYAACSVYNYSEVEAELAQGKTLAQLMDGEVSYVCDVNDVKTVNAGGLALFENNLKRNSSHSLICDLKNAKGGRTLTHHKVTTAATSDGQGGGEVLPEVDPYVGTMTDDMFKAMIWDYTASESFQYKGSSNVFIQCGGEWCHNCREMEPIVYELSGEFGQSVNFFSLNVSSAQGNYTDTFRAICKAVGYNGGIPLFVMITADGKISYTAGNMPKAKLRKFIESNLPQQPDGGDQPSTNGPEFSLNGTFNPANSTAIISMICQSKDATEATYVFISTMMVNGLLQAGSTLDSVVNQFSTKVSFDANALADFNGDGYVKELPMDAGDQKSFVLVAKNAKGGMTAQRVDVK